MIVTLTRIRPKRKPLEVDEKERIFHILRKLVGVCDGPGIKHGCAYPEVLTDDDATMRMPLTDDGQIVVRQARDLLNEYGYEPIPLAKLGS